MPCSYYSMRMVGKVFCKYSVFLEKLCKKAEYLAPYPLGRQGFYLILPKTFPFEVKATQLRFFFEKKRKKNASLLLKISISPYFSLILHPKTSKKTI